MTTALKMPDYDRLAAPKNATETEQRARERRARMARAGAVAAGREQSKASAGRVRAMEDAIPGYARRLIRAGVAEPQGVFEAVAEFHGMPGAALLRPLTQAEADARAEAIYWMLGLTIFDAGAIAVLFELDGPKRVVEAMTAHARASGLPVLDLMGEGA